MQTKTSIIIVTLNRPDCVQHCLECLEAQELRPEQIIVVDASADNATRQVAGNFPTILYLRNENGYGRMTASRNIGLKAATGDIIAFLDDDAFAHPGWLQNLTATYTDAAIGAVGGRVLNNQPSEALMGTNEIGRLNPNGMLTGYFAADPGKIIEVDHVMGCNMSFRREVVAELGGFREDYPGISGVREDSDMCLRVKRRGYRILFTPAACVDHVGAPQAQGQRFDASYVYFSQRNHLVLLMRHFGPVSPIVWRYLLVNALACGQEFIRKIGAAVVRLGANSLGTLTGIGSGLALFLKTRRDPVRHDAQAQAIRAALQRSAAPPREIVEENRPALVGSRAGAE